MINQKRIPFIPKLSREFKPMKHYLCETDTSAKLMPFCVSSLPLC